MKSFLIDEELANAILAYLSHQPYRDVYKFVEGLTNLPDVPQPETTDADS